MVLVLLLIVSACLCRTKAVHYIDKGNCVISATVHIRFWFGWRKQLSSLLTPKSKSRVLCGGGYTSVALVLFGSIFDRTFDSIFIAFELYHMVDPSTIQCPLSIFSVSLAIKGPVQSQFQFLWNQVQSLASEIPYIVSWY